MTDRELLELAAKAAGIKGEWDDAYKGIVTSRSLEGMAICVWNPKRDDGAAFRLAVKLRIAVIQDDPSAVCAGWLESQHCPITTCRAGPWFWKEWIRDSDGDRLATTRRAIVRAAAAIGEAME